ncbi:MAG: hypothetical protein LBE25_12745 [Arthrobacter sp.]|nr:hypothetical protein [Arthrobacter sp.]
MSALVSASALAVAAPAQAAGEATPDIDKYFGTTICGAYKDGGNGYGYKKDPTIPLTSSAWTRLLKNDPYGLKTGDRIWAKVSPNLGKTFPLYNWSSVKAEMRFDSVTGQPYYQQVFSKLNTSMNNATCGSTFWIGYEKSLPLLDRGLVQPSAGRMKIIQVRTNGISFIGVEGVMKGAVMNFRVVSGANKTYLNVHTTGPKLNFGSVEDGARAFMESRAEDSWKALANSIGKAQ